MALGVLHTVNCGVWHRGRLSAYWKGPPLMKKFMLVYHAATPEAAHSHDEEEMKAVMGAWMAWGEKVGSRMVDFGTPLAGGTRVAPDGSTASSVREVVGYTIIEAESFDDALGLAKEHPHLQMPGGCVIEVHEAQPVPGS
jgi:hypothetical protein